MKRVYLPAGVKRTFFSTLNTIFLGGGTDAHSMNEQQHGIPSTCFKTSYK